MQELKLTNGVDVEGLSQAVKHIKHQPELGKFIFRAKNEWVDGAHCRTRIQHFFGASQEDTSRSHMFLLSADEPDVLMGQDHGPNATEALLYALASCLNTTLIYHAAASDIQIDELELEMEGHLDLQGFLAIDKNVRPGYQQINVTFKIRADVSDEKLEELCKVAQRYSPVCDCLSTPVNIIANCKRME